ncbi:MAG TPA: hypothetical protein VLZ83_04255 [Edaphocola sp.]|nr:hypothetical protein [Edaphocola sp.]
MKYKFILVTLSAIGLGSGTFCQTNSYAINATGGSYTLNANTYEWSVGEMTLVSTVITPSLVITQALFQPILTEVGINPGKCQVDKFSSIRHDKYAAAQRVVPEVNRKPENLGRYLNAKEWGQP